MRKFKKIYSTARRCEYYKNMAQENVPPPKMDRFDMLGAYIASRLRLMTPKNQEYYEREILKVLTESTL